MRERLDNLLYALLLVAIALLVGFLGTRYRFVHDFSHGQRASLDAASVGLLEQLEGPIEIVSWARPQGELRSSIRAFVERYRQVKPDIRLRFVDPDADPNAARDAGVQIDGEIDVQFSGRSERLRALDEATLSSALLRLSRARERIVAFLEGDGERRIDGKANADLGQFGAVLATRGVRTVNLALGAMPRIADNLDLVVIANPRVKLGEAAVAALLAHVERGGHLLWFLEPSEDAGLDVLATALSLRILPGVVVDGGSQQFGIEDPSFVAISRHPAHAITQGFDLAILLPQPVALAAVTPSPWTISPFARSSAQSWNETGHIPKAGEPEAQVRYDGGGSEIAGPLDLAFALTRPSPKAGAREQRIVVIGDGDFLSNSFLANGGNREFATRVFDWLLADDGLIEVGEHAAPDRTLVVSDAALGVLGIGFLIGLPLLLATTGLVIWQRRRRR